MVIYLKKQSELYFSLSLLVLCTVILYI